jgi:hypothetical protein
MKAAEFETLWQKAFVAYLLDTLGHVGPIRLSDFSFGSAEPERRAIVRAGLLDIPCSDGSSLSLSVAIGLVNRPFPALPGARHLFTGVYDISDAALAELVAACLHYDLFVARLGEGHTLPLPPRSKLRSAGYEATLILRGRFYSFFQDDTPIIAGLQAEMFSVLPIDRLALEMVRERGVDVLLRHWAADQRDFFHVTAPSDDQHKGGR